jgi:hypothetical protein
MNGGVERRTTERFVAILEEIHEHLSDADKFKLLACHFAFRPWSFVLAFCETFAIL